MGAPVSADLRELVLVMYARGEMFKDIAAATRLTDRGCQKIVATARDAGDPRAALRRQTEGQRLGAKARTVRWAQDRGHMPSGLFIGGMVDRSLGGVDADWDEGRW